MKIGTGKDGFNSTVLMPATLWSQHKKSSSGERLRGKQKGRWTHNKERTRKGRDQTLLNEIDAEK